MSGSRLTVNNSRVTLANNFKFRCSIIIEVFRLANKTTIEDIILNHDRRGISVLRKYLPADYCTRAARLILERKTGSHATALIATGFYILSGRSAETDGPPGALALGEALHGIGFKTVYVTDRYALPFFSPDTIGPGSVIEFPITGMAASRAFAQKLIDDKQPSLIIATERSGAAANGRYLNMHGRDIHEYTARIDSLFGGFTVTIGIGDGGNEIGMGNLAEEIRKHPNLTPEPALTRVDELVIASVSNWGAYGVVAALSVLVRCNLLPEVEWERHLIEEIVRKGAVDGVSGANTPSVDGFDLEDNARTLIDLNKLVNSEIRNAPVGRAD
jgi:hypothetical protein